MLPNGKVWVCISCQGAADAIRDEVDYGNFAQAKSLAYKAKALADKLESFVMEKGGHLHINLIERQILEVPETLAEQLPNILEGYRADLPGLVAAGIGLTFEEATTAMKLSNISNDIELYDPDDPRFSGVKDYTTKSEVSLPINMFDQTVPSVQQHDMAGEQQEQEADNAKEQKFITKPGVEEELQAESALVNAIAQILSGGAQQQQAAQPQQQGPRDLREALEGGQVEGYQPAQRGQPQQQQVQPAKGGKPEEKSEPDGGGEDATEAKLGSLLHSVKASLPQIMSLHDKNPQAYKAAMNLVQKLVGLTKERRMKKCESLTDELNKAIKLNLPVGSRQGKWKKVMVNGKSVWRQLSAGQVLDGQGQPISVRSSNRQATGKAPAPGKG